MYTGGSLSSIRQPNSHSRERQLDHVVTVHMQNWLTICYLVENVLRKRQRIQRFGRHSNAFHDANRLSCAQPTLQATWMSPLARTATKALQRLAALVYLVVFTIAVACHQTNTTARFIVDSDSTAHHCLFASTV
jgi:hypothetical protein